MNSRAIGRLLLGLLVSGLFLWLVFRSVSIYEVGMVLEDVRPRWVAMSLVLFLLGYACRIKRWQLMLQTQNPSLRWGRCAVPFMVSIAANNVLPFRAGDVLRFFAFSSWLGIPSAKLLATLLAERMMDLLALLLALALATALLGQAGTIENVLPGMSTVVALLTAALIFLVLFLFPGVIERIVSFVVALFQNRFPRAIQGFRRQSARVFDTLRGLASGGRLPRLLFWSLAAWTFEGAVFYCVAKSVPDLSAPAAGWLAMPVGTLSTLLPSTPGYVGTFHYFVISSAVLFGNTVAAATAFAILVHIATWLPATTWGGISFVYWVLSREHQQPQE